MITYRKWIKTRGSSVTREQAHFEGWYLFGLVPLYIRQLSEWVHR